MLGSTSFLGPSILDHFTGYRQAGEKEYDPCQALIPASIAI